MDDQVLDTFDTTQLIPDFHAPRLPRECPDRATLDVADYRTRHWTSRESGPLTPGSDVHRREMCRMFRDTFNPYRPSVLEWPTLEPATLKRIVELPIWDIAVQTEGKARLRMAAYAATLETATRMYSRASYRRMASRSRASRPTSIPRTPNGLIW